MLRSDAPCPKCKRLKTLKRLPTNFKCADLICDFCGFLAQVKAWGPQKERMDAAIYFPLYIVALGKGTNKHAIYYLSADLQEPDIFEPRAPLSATAKRAGWQGFNYRLTHIRERLVRIA